MDLLTTREAAARLNLTPGRIRHYILDGRLPARKFGRDLMIDPQDLGGIVLRRAAADKTQNPKKYKNKQK